MLLNPKPTTRTGIVRNGGIVRQGGVWRGGGFNTNPDPSSVSILNADGSDRLIRPAGDLTTVHLIAPDATLYNLLPA